MPLTVNFIFPELHFEKRGILNDEAAKKGILLGM